MTRQYWIGGFYIDLSRNQITHNGLSKPVPPKALSVLTCLASNKGRVVSQEQLLSEVWPGTVVSPNTLQRSIAQLRKALGDDGKEQIYIQTHAKQGYSLECDVRWEHAPVKGGHDTTENASLQNENTQNISEIVVAENDVAENDAAENDVTKNDVTENDADENKLERPESKKRIPITLTVLVAILCLLAVGALYFTPTSMPTLRVDSLRSLTATDDKEFDATYTPDGQYIVFHRYLDKLCVNKLWAKNLMTQQEFELTESWGTYGQHTFSEDGKRLAFLSTSRCDKPTTQKSCFDLVSIDFANALEKPQQPTMMLRCKNSEIHNPVWLNNGNIALLQRNASRWKLISYSPNKHQSDDIYIPSEGDILDYDYASSDDLLAVSIVRDDNRQYIEMLKPDGRIISSHQIERPPSIAEYRPIYPNFDPLNAQFIFSTGKQIFTMTYHGDVTKINFPFVDRMTRPEFHPSGKKLLMIKGTYDSDIVKIPLPGLVVDQKRLEPQETDLSRTVFERTNLGEDDAKFQPSGDLIAFWSERSGEQQIWVSRGDGARQLTHFPIDTLIQGYDWAKDGKSLLVNANGVLTQVFLSSEPIPFPLGYPVIHLYQWDSENNTAIAAIRVKGLVKVVEYDFELSRYKEISDQRIIWALKSDDGQLIMKDQLDQYWRPGPVEPRRIDKLEQHGSGAKPFVIKNNIIYGVNSNHQLWSYNLNNDEFKILSTVRRDVDYLTDVSEKQILMTIQVSAKKEVVEISLSEK